MAPLSPSRRLNPADTELIAPLAFARYARYRAVLAAYFVVARGRKACPLVPPQHGGRAIPIAFRHGDRTSARGADP